MLASVNRAPTDLRKPSRSLGRTQCSCRLQGRLACERSENASMDPVTRFGEFITTQLRDHSIDHADGLLDAQWKSPSTQALQAVLTQFSPEQRMAVRRVVAN